MTASIRRAKPDDWPRIEALLVTAALPLEGAREAFQRGFVADREGQIVGVVALEVFEEGALLRSLAVDAASRGEGLGRRLVNAALGEARRIGVSSVYLLTTTAAAFFPRCGFAVTSRDDVPASVHQSIEFQTACPASAAVLSIRLQPAGTSA